jgi:ParB family chromosome partitioning protein
MSSDSVHFLKPGELQANPFQPRGNFLREDLSELVESIKTYGILEPLVVAHTPAGYQIIAGERRWRAAKLAGLEEIPVIVKKTTPRGMLEMAIVENVQRLDLNALERAQAFQQLQRDFNFSPTQIAQKVSKSPSYVSNTMKLLTLPDAIKDGLLGGIITEGHARAIASVEDEKSQIEIYKMVMKESASVRRAEELARRYKEETGQELTERGRPLQLSDQKVKEWEHRFQSFFHTKTKLKVTRSLRHTRVTLTLMGPPEQTQSDLDKMMDLTTLKKE